MIIKINCKIKECEEFIEIMDCDIEKIKKVLKEYCDLFDKRIINCNYRDFLIENRVWFSEYLFETIEI